jgi:hypothetical protein
MFFRQIRDFKILLNHKKRVNSVVIRSNEEIVRALDFARSRHLEAERLEQKEDTLRYKAQVEVLEWLINAE